MTDPYVGEIRMTGFDYAPPGWALCNGQTLSIAQNQVLFAVIGTRFGGNGQTTFQIPNMQGRVPVHQGTGIGLSQRVMGEISGSQSVTLLSTQMPAHTHSVLAYNEDANVKTPGGAFPAAPAASAYATTSDTTMSPQMLSIAGGNQPHENMQPYLVVSFMIALQGIFPSRN